MRFLSRNRKSSVLPTSVGGHTMAATSGVSSVTKDSSHIPQTSADLVNSWKREMEKEKPPQHCLSFLTGGSRKKSLLDDDSNESRGGTTNKPDFDTLEALSQDEVREPEPAPEPELQQLDLSVPEVKDMTMNLVSKGSYPVGMMDWKKAEQVLQFWTKQETEESVHLSIILLDRLVEEHEKVPKWSDNLMLYWFKAVVQNWNKGQRKQKFVGFTPEDMIDQIEAWDNCVDLDPDIYSMLVDGAAFSQPYLADSFLRRTVESQNKGLIYSHAYNQVIRAWVDAGDPYQAEALLDFMMTEWRTRMEGDGEIAAMPTRQCFHWVLLGWANSNETVAADRTQTLLEKMERYSRTGDLPAIKPNIETYQWVLDCILKSATRHAEGNAVRAQRIVDKLQEKADCGEENFRPTVHMYSALVSMWGKAGNPDKGEELLQTLYKDYCDLQYDERLKPNLDIFNNLLLAWSKVPEKSHRRKAGERAHAILDHMEKLAASEVLPGVKPDIKSYNTVLECWSRCGDGEKAQDVLDRMIKRFDEEGDEDIAPDTTTYSRVLSAWNRAGEKETCEEIVDLLVEQFNVLRNYRIHPNLILCGLAKFGTQPEALRKAKGIFQKMEDLYRSGRCLDFKPTVTSYSHLLDCVVKADRGQSGTQAETILNEMLDKYSQTGDLDLKPNVTIYNSVMKALVKTRDPKRTEEVLAQMYEEDTRGSRVYPNLETFNTILLAWAKSGLGSEASKRGEQILRRLERIHESRILQNVKPDVVSYNHVLECLVQDPDKFGAGKRAEAILKKMEENRVEPNSVTYNRVILVLKNSGESKKAKHLMKQLKDKAVVANDDLDLDLDHGTLKDNGSVQWF